MLFDIAVIDVGDEVLKMSRQQQHWNKGQTGKDKTGKLHFMNS